MGDDAECIIVYTHYAVVIFPCQLITIANFNRDAPADVSRCSFVRLLLLALCICNALRGILLCRFSTGENK